MNKQDEEKAIELVDKTHLYEEGTKYLHTDRVMCETLLEMAAWKEQQMIEKAVSILRDEIQYHDIYEERDIETFRKRIMEEN